MQANELREYLGIVVDMEKNIFLQNRMIASLRPKISALGHKNEYAKPIKPVKPGEPMTVHNWWIIPVYILASIICCFLCFEVLLDSFLSYILAPIIPGCLIGAVVTLCKNIKGSYDKASIKTEWEEKYKQDIVEYEIYKAKYERLVAEDNKRLQAEYMEQAVLRDALAQLQAQNAESRSTLAKIYDKNIIYPKYRNLPMVCSLYEYLCTGRCSQLEGHEGGYNILEMEIRLDRIIVQLDRVIASLNAIEQNQFMLYSAIQESNQIAEKIYASTQDMATHLQTLQEQNAIQGDAIIAEIQQAKKASAVTAYHTERVQKELAYLNRMNYYSGRNDSTFFNLPPT